MTYFKRTGFFLLFLVACTIFVTHAQKHQQNLQYEDLKPYHFGFLVGIHTQDLTPEHSGIPDPDGNTWYGSVADYAPGFSVGVLGDLRLTNRLSLRSTPTIHFGNKIMTLHSDVAGVSPVESNIRSNYLLIPLNIRFRATRIDNYRPYIMSGFSAGFDMGRDKNQPILLQSINAYWEIGAGIDLYMPFFKLVPEVKFCLGLGDVMSHNRDSQSNASYSKYATGFNAITSRLLVFSLQVE